MSDEIRTAVDLRASIVDQRGGIERFDGPQRRLLDALVAELAKRPDQIDVRAVTDLMAMLPRPVSVPERDNHPDPREVMFKIYMEMRERGEVPPEGWHQRRIDILEAENERLRAQLAGKTLEHSDVPKVVERLPRGGSAAIDLAEADITPPGEIGSECYAGIRPGPDDPSPRSTQVIEAKAVKRPNPPAASAAPQYDYNREQGWKDYVEADGTIRSTPRGRGHYWGPV
jgi:hypothetical protein